MRIRNRTRAARSRASVPDGRESRRRRAVWRDGPDDVRVRRRACVAGAPVPACRTAGAGACSGRHRTVGTRFRRASRGRRIRLRRSPHGRVHGSAHPLRAHGRARRVSGEHRTPTSSNASWRATCRKRCPATNSSPATVGTADTVTSVERGRRYRVRAPTAHPVYERSRAETFRRLLPESADDARRQLGELMYESHASYGRCGLGSEGTDRLVALVRARRSGGGLIWRADHRRRQRRYRRRDRAPRSAAPRSRAWRMRTSSRPDTGRTSLRDRRRACMAFGARSITL